jgi:tetratricopeptide (TPR) repeat protein
VKAQYLASASNSHFVEATDIAIAYAQMGDKDKAFEALSRAIEENSDEVAWVNTNPLCDPLRSDPRWEPLMRKIGVTPWKAKP